MASQNRSGLLGLLALVLLCALGLFYLLQGDSSGAGGGLLDDEQSGGVSEDGARTPGRDAPQLAAGGRARSSLPGPGAAGRDAADGTAAPEPGSDLIEGNIADAQGHAIAGATVALVAPGAMRGADGRWLRSATGSTDAQGRFTLKAPRAGMYRLLVSAPGRASQEVFVRAGETSLRLALQDVFRLGGVLVSKDSGEPLPNLSLRASAQRAGDTEPGRVVSTDENGQFLFLLPRERVYFIFFPSGARPFFGSQQSGEWLPAQWGPFAEPREDLDLTLAKGLAIAGKVQDASGGPVAETLRVEVFGHTSRGDVDYRRRRLTNTAEDGSFRVTGLPAGSYLVTFKPPVATGGAHPSGLTARELEGVTAGTEDLVVEISQGEPMHGVLVDEEGAPVLAKGTVYVYPQGSSADGTHTTHAKLDGKGGFKTPPLDPGTAYDLYVTHLEGYRQTHVQGVRTGAALIRVTLERASVIKGRVLREDGTAAPLGTGVLAIASNAPASNAPAGTAGAVAYTSVGPKGEFTLNGLGDYEYRINAGGAGSGFIGTTAAEGIRAGAREVVVHVKRGVFLSGRLIDAHGEPVKTHLLTAHPIGAGSFPAGTTGVVGDEGIFRFAGVHPGPLRITAYVGGRYVEVGRVTAPARDVVLRLPEE